MFDLIIKDASIIDGTGNEPYRADIGITGSLITAIGNLRDAGKILPAKGLAVSPGFIDVHAHSDFTILADPRAEGKILQGITTEINGNCGMSAAPLHGGVIERREEDLRELAIKERWNTVREYRDIIERRGTALNFSLLAGHGNIRGAVMGYEDREPTPRELARMIEIFEESIAEGASGLSTGLIYPPGIYTQTAELMALGEVLRNHALIYTTHMRSEGTSLIESIQEVVDIGRETGVRVHISHIKTAGEQNWHKAEQAITLIENARSSGIEISCDRYPYVASSTDLDSVLPSWVFEGGNDRELLRLQDGDTRKKIRAELYAQVGDATYWNKVILSSVASEKNRWMEGRTVSEISKTIARDELETVFCILIEERLRVGAIFLSMSEDNLNKFLSLPYCAIGSDSSARCFDGPTRLGRPHPRTFGTFPRFLGRYVRDQKLISLPEAVHKATLLPAKVFKLKGRGQIREGMFADLVIFDPDTIVDRSTFADPYQRPEGIPYVMINGTPVVWEGIVTGNMPGRMLTV